MLSKKLDLSKDIKPLGRTSFDERGLLVGWNAAGAEFSFKGTGFTAHINGIRVSEAHLDRFSCEIDGVVQAECTEILQGDNIIKVEGLEDKPHRVKLFKSCLLIFTYSAISEIEVYGEILPPPEKAAHSILAIGDSISVGRVVLARGSENMNTHGVNDCTLAYPYRTAAAFGADFSLTAASGYGIVSGADGNVNNTIPANFVYDVPGAKTPCRYAEKPDLIIFNLGTNDTAAKNPKEAFAPAARAFFEKIRAEYGDVPLVIFYGAMGDAWKETYLEIIARRAENGDSNMYFCPLERTRPEHTICAHPTDDMGAIYAQETVKFIENTFGWKRK